MAAAADESVSDWCKGRDGKTLEKMIGGVKVDNETCRKPKCKLTRHFALTLAYHAVGNVEEAEEHLRDAANNLARLKDREHDNVFVAVLANLVRRFAEETGIPLGDDVRRLGSGDSASVESRSMARYQKGKFLMKLHAYEEAEKEFRGSLDLSPQSTFALMALGKTLRERRRSADRFRIPDLRERECFRTKFEKDDDPRAAVRLAVTEMEELRSLNRELPMEKEEYESRWSEIVELANVGKASGSKANVFVRVGDIYMGAPASFGLKGDAEEMYRRALAENPAKSAAHHKLGRTLVFLGRVEEGVGHLLRATEKVGGNLPANMDYLSIQFYRDKDFDLEAEFLRAAEKAAGCQEELAVTVAHAQYRSWTLDYDGALELLDRASELQKKFGIPESTGYDVFPAERWKNAVARRSGSGQGAWRILWQGPRSRCFPGIREGSRSRRFERRPAWPWPWRRRIPRTPAEQHAVEEDHPGNRRGNLEETKFPRCLKLVSIWKTAFGCSAVTCRHYVGLSGS